VTAKPVAVIVAGPGTNRDRDLALALELAGADTRIVSTGELEAKPAILEQAQLVGVPGGFSYGDSLGAGRMMALDLTAGPGLSDALKAFVGTGKPVIGICNGFQVLTRTKLLPGALGHNAHGRFECRWVQIEAEPASRCVWTKGITQTIHCPIAHGEGRYVHPDVANLAEAGQVALRYRSTNPNGSVADIAGVCNPAGNVLGLMPHPENFIVPRQHPHHATGRHSIGGLEHHEHIGLQLFRNGVRAAGEF
jgi:phosphoribosylformylglycinamidine synthase I